MGVDLAPIIVKHFVTLSDLRGRVIAVDANEYLYQFLALIRRPDGRPLTDSEGNVTSHLVGLVFRTTRLIADYDMGLVFVFDGAPPSQKRRTISSRQLQRAEAEKQWRTALDRGDRASAFSKAVMTSRLTRQMVCDAQKVLDLLGIPWIQAPSEAEAQAAYMAGKRRVWASGSKDYDSLLFGAARLVRYLTISGREYLPSKHVSRRIQPELIILNELLQVLGLTREQLVELALLTGTDYHQGIKGIGPRTALKLMRKYGSITDLPEELRTSLPTDIAEIKDLFLHPNVTDDFNIIVRPFSEEMLFDFLCRQKSFSEDRVRMVAARMKAAHAQGRLFSWLK